MNLVHHSASSPTLHGSQQSRRRAFLSCQRLWNSRSCQLAAVSTFKSDRLVQPAQAAGSDEAQTKTLNNAACHAELSPDVFARKVQELSQLLPGMSRDRMLRMDPRLLARMVLDTPGIAARLVALHDLFPTADIATLVSRRPALLLKEEFAGVPAAKAELERLFPEKDIDSMVEEQPLLLIENVGQAIEELRRLLPQQDPLEVVRYNPHTLISGPTVRGSYRFRM